MSRDAASRSRYEAAMDHAHHDAGVLERAKRLANIQMFTIDLQIRRLRTPEPEDDDFVFRFGSDLQFLILALT